MRSRPAPQPGSQHGLLMVPEEVRRAHSLRCCCCKRRGAAMGCDVPACRRSYHLPCAMLEVGDRGAVVGAGSTAGVVARGVGGVEGGWLVLLLRRLMGWRDVGLRVWMLSAA